VVLGWLLIVLAMEQLSVALGVPSEAIVALQVPVAVLTFIAAGQVITGFWLSVTVTVCVQVVVLLLASVTVQVTRLEPKV
jgi:hypothetical protein